MPRLELGQMLTTGNQLKAARALIDMGQSELADRAKVNVNTVRNMEASGAGPIAGRAQNVQAVQAVLEGAGVEFLNGNKPGVRLKMQGPVDEGLRPNQLTSENDG